MWVVYLKKDFTIVSRHDMKVFAVNELSRLRRSMQKEFDADYEIRAVGGWWSVINRSADYTVGVFDSLSDAKDQMMSLSFGNSYMVVSNNFQYDICEMNCKTEEEWKMWMMLNKKV